MAEWKEIIVVELEKQIAQNPHWDAETLRELIAEQINVLDSYENKQFRDDSRQRLVSENAVYLFSVTRALAEREKDIVEGATVHVTDFYFNTQKLRTEEDWRLAT